MRLLPPVSAAKLAGLFEQHALVRRGKLDGSKEHSVYRGVLEMEELLLRWEEEVKEGKPANEVNDLMKKMDIRVANMTYFYKNGEKLIRDINEECLIN